MIWCFPFVPENGTSEERKKRERVKGEKERFTHLNAEFRRIARRDKKAFLSDQCKEIEEKKIEWEELEITSKKLEIPREDFMPRLGLPW